jgi:hypothetical protein
LDGFATYMPYNANAWSPNIGATVTTSNDRRDAKSLEVEQTETGKW